jgi:hypothetical protein
MFHVFLAKRPVSLKCSYRLVVVVETVFPVRYELTFMYYFGAVDRKFHGERKIGHRSQMGA